MLEISEAMPRAQESAKQLDGFFLASIFAMTEDKKDISEWTFLYYNPETKKVVDFFVSEDGAVKVGEETPALADMQPLDFGAIGAISVKEILEKAKKLYGSGSINILLTLHTKENVPVLSVTFVGYDFVAELYDFDLRSGEKIGEAKTSLVKKISREGS